MVAHTTILRLTKQDTGAGANIWGQTLNQQVFDLVDEAVGGMVTANVAAANVTLTTVNGSTDQARQAIIDITGAPGAARSVFCPDTLTKPYIVRNSTTGGQTITFTTVSGTGVDVPATRSMMLFADGTNVIDASFTALAALATSATLAVDSEALGAFAAALYARLALSQTWTASQRTSRSTLTESVGVVAVDATASNTFYLSLTASGWAISNPTGSVNGQVIEIVVQQDATGSRTVSWGTDFKWQSGTAPTLSTGIHDVDVFGFSYVTGLTGPTPNMWIGSILKDFS